MAGADHDSSGFIVPEARTMPWQIAPPLMIMAGAFAATGIGNYYVHKVFTGKVRIALPRCFFSMPSSDRRMTPHSRSASAWTSSIASWCACFHIETALTIATW